MRRDHHQAMDGLPREVSAAGQAAPHGQAPWPRPPPPLLVAHVCVCVCVYVCCVRKGGWVGWVSWVGMGVDEQRKLILERIWQTLRQPPPSSSPGPSPPPIALCNHTEGATTWTRRRRKRRRRKTRRRRNTYGANEWHCRACGKGKKEGRKASQPCGTYSVVVHPSHKPSKFSLPKAAQTANQSR